MADNPPMPSALPRHGLVLVAVILGLWGFALFARVLPTPAVLGVWFLVALVMLDALLPRKRLRRRAWLGVFFRERSAWRRRLRGGLLMAGLQLCKALVLSAALLSLLVRVEDTAVWRLLVAGALMLVLVRAWVQRWFARELNPAWRPEPVWWLSLRVAGVALLLMLVLLAFQRPQPDFTEASLAQAVWHQLDQEAARSDVLHEAVRMLAAKEGFQLWLGQHLSGLPVAGGAMVALVWLLVFLEQGLFVVGLLVLFNGALSRLPPDAVGERHGN